MEYVLEGTGFDLIPNDAVGTAASSNDYPTQGSGNQNPVNIYDIVEKGRTFMRLVQRDPAAHGGYTYLGCIVSADRSHFYWINETRPL